VKRAALLLAATSLLPARGEEAARPPGLEEVGIAQRLGESVPMDLSLVDEDGRPVRLGDLLGGKPAILSLVYYDCPMLCTLVLDGLVSSLRTISLDVGTEFRVITVSIDPEETPALAAAKKDTVLAAYGRAGAATGWRFLTGDATSIRRLADAVGFRYRYDPATGEFAHASGVTVLTPEGRIARYLLGIAYAPRDVRLALVEASRGEIGSLADHLLLYCYRYDPATGRYGASVLLLVRALGIATVAGLTVFVIRSRRREARARC
jgi:protein SCO1/2